MTAVVLQVACPAPQRPQHGVLRSAAMALQAGSVTLKLHTIYCCMHSAADRSITEEEVQLTCWHHTQKGALVFHQHLQPPDGACLIRQHA